jgi:hypothetical protein
VGRGPQVPAHSGPDPRAGELPAHRIGGAPFKPLNENRNRQRGWISQEQVHVAGLAVELGRFGIKVGAAQRHAVPVAVVGRGCQCSPLRLCCG